MKGSKLNQLPFVKINPEATITFNGKNLDVFHSKYSFPHFNIVSLIHLQEHGLHSFNNSGIIQPLTESVGIVV